MSTADVLLSPAVLALPKTKFSYLSTSEAWAGSGSDASQEQGRMRMECRRATD